MRSTIRLDLLLAMFVGLLICGIMFTLAMRLDAICSRAFVR